ncbi:MAG: phosphomethylpyrimidine synthase ThiC [Desulfobacterota bacterium]|nr:phosphomethylpyrimidine synthase ThiC [Thermodesulfobacteriota bacterium]
MTQLEHARCGETTPAMQAVAAQEGISVELVRERVAAGTIVIIKHPQGRSQAVGVGAGLRTKVNASIGTSSDIVDEELEVRKARIAQENGADTLMELSVGGDLDNIRRRIIDAVELPVGNVPLYQAFCEAQRRFGSIERLEKEFLFELIERQCSDGIAFMAIHCGINRMSIERLRNQGYRYGGLVSKGGALLVRWMLSNNKENPLYEHFDRVVGILKKYDVVLSLGNGMRAGAIHDSSDRAMIQELVINCELAELGRTMGCQTMVEGPGHVPIDEIEQNIQLQKKMSGGAPYYVLGPITTDIAPGYDHLTAAIGAAHSARYGADLICYITPAEHLALPNEDDVREGVRMCKIAAYIGDMIKYGKREKDREIAKARRDLDWERQFEIALYGDTARSIRESRKPHKERSCTMCGAYCAMDNVNIFFKDALERGGKK